MREWVRIGWHLDGMPYEAYLQLTEWERIALLIELDEMIGRANSPRPKDMK